MLMLQTQGPHFENPCELEHQQKRLPFLGCAECGRKGSGDEIKKLQKIEHALALQVDEVLGFYFLQSE